MGRKEIAEQDIEIDKLKKDFSIFLDHDKIPCLVKGCNWIGDNLSLHVRQAHGIDSKKFKKLTGFNVSTGLVSRKTKTNLKKRSKVGIALTANDKNAEIGRSALKKMGSEGRYRSNEFREKIKNYIENAPEGPIRICLGCGIEFNQKKPTGYKKYCSIACRDKYYADKKKSNKKPIRNKDGTFLRWE